MHLRKFQKKAISEFTENDKLTLLRADMGLGKTAIATHIADAVGAPTVFVCPAGIKYEIEANIALWTKRPIKHFCDHPTLLNGFLIIAYTELGKFDPARSGYTLIFDECQYLKNIDAKRTIHGVRLANNAGRLLGMTGTLMMSRPSDLYSIGYIFIPKFRTFHNNFLQFAFKFCAPKKIRVGQKKVWDFSGASNLGALGKIYSPHTYDIKKVDVLPELPTKRYEYVYLAPNEYMANRIEKAAQEKLNVPLDGRISKEVQEHSATYRKRIGKLKIKPAINHIKRLLESEEKVVVFCFHQNVTQEIFKAFKKEAVIVMGGSTAKQRQANVEAFQNGGARVFVGQIIAAGVGLTLTAAHTCVFVEYDWTPGNNMQAADRIHRIGQTEPVLIQYLTIKDSIDDRIFKSVTNKETVIDTFMSSVNVKTNHHAELAPSSATRWFACPGSVIATRGIEQTVSPAAAEGTRAHQYAEDFLTGKIKWQEIPPHFADELKAYVAHVKSLKKKASIFAIEDKLKTGHKTFSSVYGTADFVAVCGNTLHVVDLKFGKSVYVSVKNNKQLLIYGWLAYLKHVYKKNDKITSVRLTIVQPRIKVSESVRSWDVSLKELFLFAVGLRAAIKRTKLQDVAYVKGDHCLFCPAKHQCKTYMEVQ